MTTAAAQGFDVGDDPTPAELALEVRFMKERHTESSRRIEAALERLERKIDGLDFVPRGEHMSHLDQMAKSVESSRGLSMWALGLVAAIVVMVAGAMIVAAAGL